MRRGAEHEARRYELHHGVRISDSALVDAAVLSSRYIADRFLPDKAIDLIDESAAKLKMEITSKPLALDEIDRKVWPAARSRMPGIRAARCAVSRLAVLWRRPQGCHYLAADARRCVSWRWSASA